MIPRCAAFAVQPLEGEARMILAAALRLAGMETDVAGEIVKRLHIEPGGEYNALYALQFIEPKLRERFQLLKAEMHAEEVREMAAINSPWVEDDVDL